MKRPEDSRAATLAACFALVLPAVALSACTPVSVATTAGAMAATAAQEERGLDGATRDGVIRAAIFRRWLEHDNRLVTAVDATVHERRVLLTGVVTDQDLADAAVRLAWQADGVSTVINEIAVRTNRSLGDRTRDALIRSTLRSRLLLDSRVKSINYAVDVMERTVYVMGVAQSEAELQRVLSWARNTDYVRRVVSHVLLKDDPARVAPGEEVQ